MFLRSRNNNSAAQRILHNCFVQVVCAFVLVLLAVLPSALRGAEQVDPSAEWQKVESDYATQLTELAKWCDERQLTSQAELTRNWLPTRDPLKDYIFVIPENASAPAGLAESEDAKEWWQRFAELRRAQAEKLFALAESAAQAKQPAATIQLARQTLRENPDHERARKILGFEQFDNRWVSPKAAQRLRAGKVWSDDFGWLPADQLAQYQNGQRFYRGKWIDADEEARLRGANMNNGWNIETEHYLVRTSAGLEEGVRLARRLESLYDVWRATFVGYYAKLAEVEQWFAAGVNPRANTGRKPYTVIYFRDKQQYLEALRPLQPQVDISVGTYLDRLKVAYFFAGDKQSAGTIYHEATHQLFREERPGAIEPGRKNNFWVVEAIACYMESLAEHCLLPDQTYGMYFTLGGANEGRVPAARARLHEEQYRFYLPIRELVAPGMEALQRDSRLPQIYSQSSGLAWFLMHADDGRYRQALMDYLVAVYTGRAGEATLEKLTGMKYEDLDRQYREFMK